MKRTIIAALMLAVLLAGCGGAKQPAKDAANEPTKGTATEPQAQQGPVQQGQGQAANPQAQKKSYTAQPTMTIDPKKSYVATMETNLGTMKIELFAADAPITVNNFVFLAREGFYDGLTFHRIIKDFMIQGGDPQGTGRGGPGYRFNDELPPKQKYTKGIVAMANAGRNTQGSQFFICTVADCGGLDRQPNYTQFGKVVEGLDVLDKLASVEVVAGGESVPSRPKVPPIIQKVTISEK